MAVPAILVNLIGQWRGTNRLWLSPADPVHESDITMLVAAAAQGRFITFQYTWSYEGNPQDGLLLLGVEPHPEAVQAIWIDSWHMQDKYLHCLETIGDQGDISLNGSYSAPPGPDWGWKIEIIPRLPDEFQLRMYNISPGGMSQLAVHAEYIRKH
jgi:hypothetical protein